MSTIQGEDTNNGFCPYCGCRFMRNHYRNKPTRDHVYPVRRSGYVVILACTFCNHRKGASNMRSVLRSKWLAKRRAGLARFPSQCGEPLPDAVLFHLYAEAKRKAKELLSPEMAA